MDQTADISSWDARDREHKVIAFLQVKFVLAKKNK